MLSAQPSDPTAFLRRHERFRLLARLGEGGQGLVYEALDRQHDTRVALKLLCRPSPDGILRFKQEFRSSLDLQHPNLVRLGELFEQGGHWFFTMELIEGSDLFAYVRGLESGETMLLEAASAVGKYDEVRLRDALMQLARGLSVLHQHGKVHRDVKPSNVRVERASGRVVLLDFGLLVDVSGSRFDERVGGTVAYMAPEQAAGHEVGPSADCYALGVLLFELLTGQLPYTGSAIEQLTAKQTLDAPAPSQLVKDVPSDLDALCVRLMQRACALRPSAEEVYGLLSRRESAPGRTAAPLAPRADPPDTPTFVGRRSELQLLESAFVRSRVQPLTKLCVHGESGIGKSTLAGQFCENLRALEPSHLLLFGRCSDPESVPYNAFDAAIDSLGRELANWTRDECLSVLPRRAGLLPLIFPVLGRVLPLSTAPVGDAAPDGLSQRQQAFSALRELLCRVAERRPLVFFLDDFHGADAESRELLQELLRGPDQPQMLLVVLAWPERDCPEPVRSALAQLFSEAAGERVSLGPLSPRASEELAARLFVGLGTQLTPGVRSAAAQIAHDTAGHPLFIERLVRLEERGSYRASPVLRVEQALAQQLDELSGPAQVALTVLAMALRPLGLSALAEAANLPREALSKALRELRLQKLVRVRRAEQEPKLEVYHARVRDVALQRITEPAPQLHGRIAEALQRGLGEDHEALASHFALADRPAEARSHLLLAAEGAERALAFEQAANLYQRAAALGVVCSEQESRALLCRTGHALSYSGRGALAARSFGLAASSSEGPARLDLLRLSAEHYLRAGHVEEGLETGAALLAGLGYGLSKSPNTTVMWLIWRRLRVWVRGRKFVERPAHSLPPEALLACDAFWSLSSSLASIDPIRGCDLHSRGLLLALELGEPARLARALAFEALVGVVGDNHMHSMARGLMATVEALARRLADPYLLALSQLHWAWLYLTVFELPACLQHASEAARLFEQTCQGAPWELSAARMVMLSARTYLGRLDGIELELEAYVREAEQRGDLFSATSLLSFNRFIVDLAADRPDAGEALIEAAMRRWPDGMHMQHAYALCSLLFIDLYRGGAGAHERVERAWPRLSLILRSNRGRICLVWQRGLAALAVLVAGGGERAKLLKLVRRLARSLAGEDFRDAHGAGLLLCAQADELEGELQLARAGYERALEIIEPLHMDMHCAALHHKLGALGTGAEALNHRRAADGWLSAQNIRNPARFIAMLAPV